MNNKSASERKCVLISGSKWLKLVTALRVDNPHSNSFSAFFSRLSPYDYFHFGVFFCSTVAVNSITNYRHMYIYAYPYVLSVIGTETLHKFCFFYLSFYPSLEFLCAFRKYPCNKSISSPIFSLCCV